jgi:hypothetical protein
VLEIEWNPHIKCYYDKLLCTHPIAQDKTCEETGIKLNVHSFQLHKALHKRIGQMRYWLFSDDPIQLFRNKDQ